MDEQVEQAGAERDAAWISYEEFLEHCDEDTHAEWVDGRVVPMSPVSRKHQKTQRFLLFIVERYAAANGLGEVEHDPFQMKTGHDLPGRAPDILFVATEHLDRFEPNYLNGPADLVIEVISPGGRTRDRAEKFDEYERGGVREYWVVDSERKRAEFFQLDDGGAYQAVAPNERGVYRSAVLEGLWLEVGWLWQDPLPDPISILKELGVP